MRNPGPMGLIVFLRILENSCRYQKWKKIAAKILWFFREIELKW